MPQPGAPRLVPAPHVQLLDQEGRSVALRRWRGKPVLLVFLRWLGWVPCREHLARLREQGKALERAGAVVLVVSFEPPSELARFAKQAGLPFTMLSDPHRRAYAAFGLQRGRWGRIYGWNTVRAYLRGLLAGRWPRPPHGDLGQLGGDFVLDAAGRIVFAYRGQEPADRPALGEILAAIRSVALGPDGASRP